MTLFERVKQALPNAIRVGGPLVARCPACSRSDLVLFPIRHGHVVAFCIQNDCDEAAIFSAIGLTRVASTVEVALALLALVNVFVGVLNVIPLYPLDGGHFAVALYERIRGRSADVRKLLPVAAAVLCHPPCTASQSVPATPRIPAQLSVARSLPVFLSTRNSWLRRRSALPAGIQ